jgi:hypothetical protein
MPYPFVQSPTFAELIGRLTSSEFGCEFETVEAPMMVDGDENQCISIHFLKRVIDGTPRTYALYVEDFETRVAFSVLRSILDRLEIDRAAFGLTLD